MLPSLKIYTNFFVISIFIFFSLSYLGNPTIDNSRYFNAYYKILKYIPILFLVFVYFTDILLKIRIHKFLFLIYTFILILILIFSKNIYFSFSIVVSLLFCILLSSIIIHLEKDNYILLKIILIYFSILLIAKEGNIGFNNYFGGTKLSLGYYYPKDNAAIISFITILFIYISSINKNLIWLLSFIILFLIGNYVGIYIHLVLFLIINKFSLKYISIISIIVLLNYFLMMTIIYLMEECSRDFMFKYFSNDESILRSLSERLYRSCGGILSSSSYVQLDNSLIEIFNMGLFNIILVGVCLIFINYCYSYTLPIILTSYLFQSGLFIAGNLSFITLLTVILVHANDRINHAKRFLSIK